jgi:hypothetical protein
MWGKLKSIIMFKNDKDSDKNSNKTTHRFEIGDNVYWILWWFGIFTLMFFEKC